MFSPGLRRSGRPPVRCRIIRSSYGKLENARPTPDAQCPVGGQKEAFCPAPVSDVTSGVVAAANCDRGLCGAGLWRLLLTTLNNNGHKPLQL